MTEDREADKVNDMTNQEGDLSPAKLSQLPSEPSSETPSQTRESRQQTVDTVLGLKSDIAQLIGNIRSVRRLCDKYDNDNEYMKEYVGTLMSGDIKK